MVLDFADRARAMARRFQVGYAYPDLLKIPTASNPQKNCPPGKFCPIGQNARKMRMAQSRRHERPRSSRLQHSASFRARNPNKASMTLMLAAASICATDALERHLAPPGFQCCERDLLGRSKPQESGMRKFRGFFPGTGNISRIPSFLLKFAHGPISTPSPSQKLSFSPFCIILRKESE